MTPGKDYYQILQIVRTAEPSVVRASYKVLIQKYHPDRHLPRLEAEAMTRMLNEAYAVLSDPGLRAQYDADLERPAKPGGAGVPPPVPPAPPAPPATSFKRSKSWPWLSAITIAALIGSKISNALLREHVGAIFASLLGCALGLGFVHAFTSLWERARTTGLRILLVSATCLLVGGTGLVVAQLVAFQPSPPVHTTQQSKLPKVDFESSFLPPKQAQPANAFDQFDPVPESYFGEVDQRLASHLNVALPLPLGQRTDPTFVWETRQKMFLTMPENAHLYSSDALFTAWKKGMQEAVDGAAARGLILHDYQIMEEGRSRVR